MDAALKSAIIDGARDLGVDPVDLATVMAYETGGTFDPWQKGPTTKWGTHRGLIQWGEPQRKQYGITKGMPIVDQLRAVGRYLRNAGVRAGMGLLDIYSAVNAGRVGRPGASDRPGKTVRSHVAQMTRQYRPGMAAELAGVTSTDKSEATKYIQFQLQRAGLDPGPIDG